MPEANERQKAESLEQRRLASLNARRAILLDIDDLEKRIASRSRPRSIPDPAFPLETVLDRLADAQARLQLHDDRHAQKFGNVEPLVKEDARDQLIRALQDQVAHLERERNERIGRVACAANQ